MNEIKTLASAIEQKCIASLDNPIATTGSAEAQLQFDEDESRLLIGVAEALSAARRVRNSAIPDEHLFADPAWDILLDLYLAHAQQKAVSVTSASMATNVPSTTALRWVWLLESKSLVLRLADKADKRRHFIVLSDEGLAFVRRMLRTYIQFLRPIVQQGAPI